MKKRAVAILLAAVLLISASGTPTFAAENLYTRNLSPNALTELTDSQYNSIAMLNYLVALTQSINASDNSRLYLEEAYSSLINNTAPKAVDNTTQSYLSDLLDTLEKYRMIEVKRERLQYIYEQNKAQALRAAIPNPISVLNVASSLDIKKLVLSVVYMAADSYSSYSSYNNATELDFLKDNWTLDDEEATALHQSRKQALNYMIDIVRDYDLQDSYALNDTSLQEFGEYKNEPNIYRRIQFFESNQATYKMFGSYWLALAESYYTNGNYEECLQAVEAYEEIQARIFRKDHEFARTIPLAIASAEEVMTVDGYIDYASEYLSVLCKNIENGDWALRYFAAETYLDLYARTKDPSYLDQAYELTKNNVNYLVDAQKRLNDAYMAEIEDEPVPKGATKEQKNDIKKYNKMIKADRKVALPPVYAPLALNCELLFKLADEKKVTDSEKKKIDGILHGKGENIFLCNTLDSLYRFTPGKYKDNATVEFNEKSITIPVTYLTSDSIITVTVKNGSNTTIYEDWSVKKVTRSDKEDIYSFAATYESPTITRQKYPENTTVTISIRQADSYSAEQKDFKFKAVKHKKAMVMNSISFEEVA